MTDDPAMQRARELAAAECVGDYINAAYFMDGRGDENPALIALAKGGRAFSDAVEGMAQEYSGVIAIAGLRKFILPPAKPDPVDALGNALAQRLDYGDSIRQALRSELELAGLELREVGK